MLPELFFFITKIKIKKKRKEKEGGFYDRNAKSFMKFNTDMRNAY